MNHLENCFVSAKTFNDYSDIISSVMEYTTDSLCITDVFGKIICCSLTFANKFGHLNPSSLNGINISKIILNPDKPIDFQDLLGVNEFSNCSFNGFIKDKDKFNLVLAKRIISNYDIENTKFLYILSDYTDANKIDPYESRYSLVKSVFLSLSTAIFSKLNLNELLNEILDQIGRVINFDSASISLLDGENFTVVAVKGFENPKTVIGLKFPKTQEDNSPSPNLLSLQNRKSYRLSDVVNEYPAFVNPPGLTIRSWMAIPLFSKENGIGTLNLDSFSINAFSVEDQYIGELFAAQVSVAIDNSIKFMESEKHSKFDSLTGLLTRRQMLLLSKIEIDSYDPINHPISIILFDIDKFKSINDTKGHLFGDQILKNVADLCLPKMRQDDIFSRFGGDEFIIVLPDSNSSEGKLLADRLRQTISSNTFLVSGSSTKITASFGVTNFLSEDTLDSAIQRADKALYSAKQAGRNKVVIG